jgi:hypothetical protein
MTTTYKYTISFPVKSLGEVSVTEVINLFHKWVKEQQPSQLLLDVADYSHVPDGPGILLVGFHEIIAFRINAPQPCFVVTQKSVLEGEASTILLKTLTNGCFYANEFVKALGDKLELDLENFQVGLNDRLLENPKALEKLQETIGTLNNSIDLGWESSLDSQANPKNLPYLKVKATKVRSLEELKSLK